MGFAVNSSTIGMAIAGLAVSLFSKHIDRRMGILLSLVALSVPTALLAVAPNLTVFNCRSLARRIPTMSGGPLIVP
jgi:predicted MFS family arabinose efflux permease